VVAAQHRRAAEAGAAVLAAGGDAVDAAVATSFAIGVVEPWMSGPAAGGAMVIWRAAEGRARVVDYGMRSPRELKPVDYPLSGAGRAQDLFPWAAVVDDRNVQGATAIAVPGVVAGMGLAHKTWGRMPWKDLLSPAVALAEEGMNVDWFASLQIASCARMLALDPDAARMFLDDGHWPIIGGWTAGGDRRLDQKAMARTLRRIADKGAAEFYSGDVARELVKDIRAKGGCLSAADLAAYRAEIVEPLCVAYRGGRIHAAPGLTGGPALAHCLGSLSKTLAPRTGPPGAHSYVAYAKALDAAWRDRLERSGDENEAPHAPTCTTHFSVVDRAGNFCAVTQTLLSIFGSRVVAPTVGILMNNGIMWFDPEEGNPNSLAPNKRCLANYCPVVGETADGRRFALGASGGRKILGTVLQLSSFLMDHGLDLEQAFHQPRIDMSGGAMVLADSALPAEVMSALAESFATVAVRRLPFPYHFAVPAGVLRQGEMNMGCTEIMSPWGDAVAEHI